MLLWTALTKAKLIHEGRACLLIIFFLREIKGGWIQYLVYGLPAHLIPVRWWKPREERSSLLLLLCERLVINQRKPTGGDLACETKVHQALTSGATHKVVRGAHSQDQELPSNSDQPVQAYTPSRSKSKHILSPTLNTGSLALPTDQAASNFRPGKIDLQRLHLKLLWSDRSNPLFVTLIELPLLRIRVCIFIIVNVKAFFLPNNHQ